MKYPLFMLLAASGVAYAQPTDSVGFSGPLADPNGGTTPERFPMAEDGMIFYYIGNESYLYDPNTPTGSTYKYKFTNPKKGSTVDSIREFDAGDPYNAGTIDFLGNAFDCDFSDLNISAYGNWFGSTTIKKIEDMGGSDYQGIAVGSDQSSIGIDEGPASDEIELYETNMDARPSGSTSAVGVLINHTQGTWLFDYPFTTNDPNTLPSGQSWVSFGEIAENGFWATFTSGAYFFDTATESWTLKVSGGEATGTSESGDYLVGTNGANSFVFGPSGYFEIVSSTGKTIELFDVMDEFGLAVGKATDTTSGEINPVIWDSTTDTLTIYDEFDDVWFGCIVEGGFGMFEDSSEDKGVFTLFEFYSTSADGCIADLTDDGQLNFFDVSAFMMRFNNGDASADFQQDAILNFFDVSAFISAYQAGCDGYADPEPLP